ncbi:single-stranded DNA-binding protein [Chitinophaga lutea]
MMLKLQLIGRLGQHAVQQSVNGKTVLNFSVAHNERYRNAQGVVQERTTWISCAMWEPGNVGAYLVQGQPVYAEGFPTVDLYQNNAGEQAAALRLRITYLKLLPGGPRPAGEGEAETPAVAQPADDLPF